MNHIAENVQRQDDGAGDEDAAKPIAVRGDVVIDDGTHDLPDSENTGGDPFFD